MFPLLSFVYVRQTQQQDVGTFPKVDFDFPLPILPQWDSQTGCTLQGSSSSIATIRAGGQN